ncbi:MAG TPA: YidC/Oxa1 family membrane protein insertase [Gaiellaceae bacterium]
MIPFAILEPIEKPLTAVLEWLHSSAGLSWALAIIVLTLMVRMILVPLTVRQIHSMQRLQALAPEMKAIQQKYKNDKKRQQEEIMRFYQENQVNPLASCLPIALQIPIFISLFYVLKDFEREVFPKYPNSDLGFLNIVPNITDKISEHITGPNYSGLLLLVIYVGSQVASTFFMSTTMDKRQRYLFLALPFLFIAFIVNFPIGLMLYWVTTNLWTVGQGLVTRRLVPKPAPAEKRSSRTPPKPAEAPAAAPAEKPAADGKSKQAAAGSGSGQRRVRRRKKRGPQARRR